MKKLIITLSVILSISCFAKPYPAPHRFMPGPRIMHRPPPPPPRHHHVNHSFWSGFAGGIIGSVIGTTVITPVVQSQPVIVNQPITVITPPKQVWVDGHYENRLQGSNTIVRVWIPGYWTTIQ